MVQEFMQLPYSRAYLDLQGITFWVGRDHFSRFDYTIPLLSR